MAQFPPPGIGVRQNPAPHLPWLLWPGVLIPTRNIFPSGWFLSHRDSGKKAFPLQFYPPTPPVPPCGKKVLPSPGSYVPVFLSHPLQAAGCPIPPWDISPAPTEQGESSPNSNPPPPAPKKTGVPFHLVLSPVLTLFSLSLFLRLFGFL